MVFKPNYNQQRAERNRAKEAKKEAKRAEQEEQVARRKQQQMTGGGDPEPSASEGVPEAAHENSPAGPTDAT
jgi:hypothetical protein